MIRTPTVGDQEAAASAADAAFDDMTDEELAERRRRNREKVELNAKRQAARFSPEEMSLQDARIDGAKAGARGTAAALNPYQHTEPEHAEWERARMEALHRAVA